MERGFAQLIFLQCARELKYFEERGDCTAYAKAVTALSNLKTPKSFFSKRTTIFWESSR
jgi:hypothetical protein